MALTKSDAFNLFTSLSKGNSFFFQRYDGYIEFCSFIKFMPKGTDSGVVKYGIYIYPLSQDFKESYLNLDSISTNSCPYVDVKRNFIDLVFEGKPSITNGSSSIFLKDPVRLTTISDLNAYSTGFLEGKTLTSNVVGAFSLDGIQPTIGDRILVKNQVILSDNGIYTIVELGSPITPWVLQRSSDADSIGELVGGSLVVVTEGVQNGDSIWMLTNISGTVNIDVDDIIYNYYPQGSNLLPGEGIAFSGNVISVDSSVLRDTDINDTLIASNSLWSSQKIQESLSDISFEPKTEYIHILPSHVTNKYFELSFEPINPSHVIIMTENGSVQRNKKALDSGSGLESANFSVDSISKKRVYFIDEPIIDIVHESHVGLDGFFEGIKIVVFYWIKK